MARVRPVAHDEQLTLVEHLEEFRSRVIWSLLAFGAAFALCFWQDDYLLELAERPVPEEFLPLETFGVTEPFLTTLTVVAYGAILLSLPVLLYQLYAFVLPAFTPEEHGKVRPFALAVPFLFIGGVVLGYFVIMPAALNFLLEFNAGEFNILLRARDYYGFFGIVLVSLGLTFQLPLLILAIVRLGIVSADQLAEQRRYAIVIIAVISAALPGGDPVSMFLIMIPLLLLFEGSLRLARILERRAEAAYSADLEPAAGDQPPGPDPATS